MIRQVATTAKQVGGVSLFGSVGYGVYLYNTDEGTSRMIKAYSNLGPVVVQYRWLEFRQNYLSMLSEVTDAEWEELDNRHAKPTIELLGQLQGMYCKYGQTAAGLSNTFSDTWLTELRKLESDVPAQPLAIVQHTLREELGIDDLDSVISSMDEKPLGSASIGQVHRAVLRKSGREVAIKVQYPGVGHVFREDMKSIRRFASILAPEHIVTLDALEKQNAEEIDYTIEAANLREVENNMRKGGFLPSEVRVPLPVDDGIIKPTKAVLVMDLLPGPKLIEGIKAYYRQYAAQNNTTLEKLEAEAKRKIDEEGIPAKYDGPSAAQIQRYQRILRYKHGLINTTIAVYNQTLGRIRGRPIPYFDSTLPPNTPRIVDTLMRVHGHQMLRDGCFNADPHGGNFLLLPAENGDDNIIGMIDYGATKRLTRNERITACVLYAALYHRNEDLLFDLVKVGGYKSKYFRRDIIMKLMRFSYDTWGNDLLEGRNVQQFVDYVQAEDPWDEAADNLVMCSFMSVRLRSLALGMNHPVTCSEWWGPIAKQVLEDEGLPYEKWDRAMLEKYKPELNMQKT